MKTISFYDQWNHEHCVRIDCIVSVEAYTVPDLDPQQATPTGIDGSMLILRNVPTDEKKVMARTSLKVFRNAMEETS